MKRASIFAFLMAVLSFAAALGLSAQTPNVSPAADRYVISARAGGVSYTEGSVSVTRVNGTGGVLLKRDQVEVGDQVSTGSDGRAEILLNPGSYLRLSKNSSFEFGATDLEDLTIKLNSGSAIFEVFADDEFRVSVFTPKGKVSLIETGIYRVDVAADGSALAFVTKGKAEIGETNAVVVKEGRTGTVDGSQVAINKFDKDRRDEFAEWSRFRSKEITKINNSLRDKALDTALARGFRTGRWGLHDSFGLWIYDYRSSGYCFLPYGFNWRSPYGGWYGNGIYPWYVPVVTPRTTKSPGTPVRDRITRTSTSNSVTGKESRRGVRGAGAEAPPFTKVGRGSGTRAFDFPSSKGYDSFPSGRSTPTSSAPSFPAPSMDIRPVSPSATKRQN